MFRRLIPLLSLAFTLGLASAAPAAFTTTFEDAGLAPNTAINNAGPSGVFNFDGNLFNNSYNAEFDFWSGWSISNMTNTVTSGFRNQYSAIAGSGAGGSTTYAVADAGPSPGSSYINLASAPISMAITNTTYAFNSIRDGDQFARAFAEGDYFVLDIRGYDGLSGTGNLLGTINYYLADYRNGLRSVLNTWAAIDLTSLGDARSLRFGLRSTDNDPRFGINTPTYFALDNLVVASPSVVPEPASLALVASGLGLAGIASRRRRA